VKQFEKYIKPLQEYLQKNAPQPRYNKIVTKLPDSFIGTGECKNFKFAKIASIDNVYCYEVNTPEGSTHYEVFKVKTVPICIDFENRIYSTTDYKEIYPKSKSFGVGAYSLYSQKSALSKLQKLAYGE